MGNTLIARFAAVVALLCCAPVAGQVAGGGGSGIASVSEDPAPVLGANLDVGSYNVTDPAGTTYLDLQSEAGKARVVAAGGDFAVEGDASDMTAVFYQKAGQTEPAACAEESGADRMCWHHSGTLAKSYLTPSQTTWRFQGSRLYEFVGWNSGGYLGEIRVGGGNPGDTYYLSLTASYNTSAGEIWSRVGDLNVIAGAEISFRPDNLGAGSEVLIIDTGNVEIAGCKDYGASAAAPATCDGSAACYRYYDTSTDTFCGCNGSAWIDTDGSGGVCA